MLLQKSHRPKLALRRSCFTHLEALLGSRLSTITPRLRRNHHSFLGSCLISVAGAPIANGQRSCSVRIDNVLDFTRRCTPLGICTSQEKVVVDDMSDLTLARPGFHLSVRGQLRRTALVTYFGVTSFLKDEGNGRFGNRIYVRPKEFGRSSCELVASMASRAVESRQRAQRLLMQFLTPEQCRDYRRSGLFIVESQLGHRYLVGDGAA